MSVFNSILSGDIELTQNYEKRLNAIGWIINNEADYIDLEVEIAYQQSHTEAWEYDSFNLAATFDLENKNLYFIFGNNLGGGMNEKFEFRYSPDTNMTKAFLQAKQGCEDTDFTALMDKYPDDINDVITDLNKLISLIENPVSETA